MWAFMTVGQVPGDVSCAFAPLFPMMIYKLECGSTSLPSLFLHLLWVLYVADSDVGLATDASYFAVMALSAFGDAGDGFLHFSGNGIVCFSATVPGTIEMSFEVADASGYCL